MDNNTEIKRPKREDYESVAEFMKALREWIKDMLEKIFRNPTFSMINPELRKRAEETFSNDEVATLVAMNYKDNQDLRGEIAMAMESFAESLEEISKTKEDDITSNQIESIETKMQKICDCVDQYKSTIKEGIRNILNAYTDKSLDLMYGEIEGNAVIIFGSLDDAESLVIHVDKNLATNDFITNEEMNNIIGQISNASTNNIENLSQEVKYISKKDIDKYTDEIFSKIEHCVEENYLYGHAHQYNVDVDKARDAYYDNKYKNSPVFNNEVDDTVSKDSESSIDIDEKEDITEENER